MFLHTCPFSLDTYINYMPKITYKDFNGNSKTINVQSGLSVMEGAIQNDIPGISFWIAPSITESPFSTSIVFEFP